MDQKDCSDVELLQGCISGGKKEWNIFIQRYSKLIYHTIYKTLRVNDAPITPDDVDDLFQEVFASLCGDNFKKLRVYDPAKGCTLPSWLRMITVRMTIDHLRKSKPVTSINDLPIEPSQAADQETIADEDALSTLKELLAELPAKDKLLIELSFMRELPPEEVAGILNISVGAFYTRKNRILEKLRKSAADGNIV